MLKKKICTPSGFFSLYVEKGSKFFHWATFKGTNVLTYKNVEVSFN